MLTADQESTLEAAIASIRETYSFDVVVLTKTSINGRTASGTRTALGTVAVDPRQIPLGSKLSIPGYGWGTALDTGGHMRGRVIDIWYPSYGQCRQWGVRNVTVTVMPR